MREPSTDPREELLAERLEAEAALSRPAFSAPLHAKLCGAISAAPLARRRDTRVARWWLAGAAAAVLAVIGGAVAWRVVANSAQSPAGELAAGVVAPPQDETPDAVQPPEDTLDPSPITSLAAESPGELSEAIDSAVLASPLESLGQDAQSALDFLRTTFPPSAATWATFDAAAPAADDESPGAS